MTCGYTGVSLSLALDRGIGRIACPALSQWRLSLLLGTDKEYRSESLDDVKDAIFRCDLKKRAVIKNFIEWYANQDI